MLIFFAYMLHGGQPSLFLHVVKTPFVILVLYLSLITLLPFNLGSFFYYQIFHYLVYKNIFTKKVICFGINISNR